MKDKNVRKALFGNIGSQDFGDKLQIGRAVTIYYPKASDYDHDRRITFRGDDGLILYLVKRIERLERQLISNAADEALSDLAKIFGDVHKDHGHGAHVHTVDIMKGGKPGKTK